MNSAEYAEVRISGSSWHAARQTYTKDNGVSQHNNCACRLSPSCAVYDLHTQATAATDTAAPKAAGRRFQDSKDGNRRVSKDLKKRLLDHFVVRCKYWGQTKTPALKTTYR
jgi:hypothetical protein